MTNLLSQFKAKMHFLFIAFLLLLASPVATSANFTVDTASSPITGLWWNQNEPGWGVTFTQQSTVIFVTLFTFDANGAATWYVASACAVSGSGCSGTLYKVTGGSAPTASWNATISMSTVGTVTLAFSDNNTGTLSYAINGVQASKAISRQMFGPSAATVTADCTPANFTQGNYSAIAVGMTLTQVNQTIGCTNNSAMTVRSSSYVMHVWGTSNLERYIQVFFDPAGVLVTVAESSGPYKLSGGF